MVSHIQQYKEYEKQFGILDSEELIRQIEAFITRHNLDLEIRSQALTLIGSIICYLAPYLKDDNGYTYFKEALELNANNYDAILGICSIFNTYPYPYNNIVTEVEFLEYVERLINNFELLDKDQRANTLQAIKSFTIFRKRIIDKHGYSSLSDFKE